MTTSIMRHKPGYLISKVESANCGGGKLSLLGKFQRSEYGSGLKYNQGQVRLSVSRVMRLGKR